MAESSQDAGRRRRRLAWANGIAIVVFVGLWLVLRLGEPDVDGLGYPLLMVAIFAAMVVFIVVVRRNLSPEHKHAVSRGEVLPDANRAELRADLERSRPGFTLGRLSEIGSLVASLVLIGIGAYLELWWLAALGVVGAVMMVLLAVWTARQRRNVRAVLDELDRLDGRAT